MTDLAPFDLDTTNRTLIEAMVSDDYPGNNDVPVGWNRSGQSGSTEIGIQVTTTDGRKAVLCWDASGGQNPSLARSLSADVLQAMWDYGYRFYIELATVETRHFGGTPWIIYCEAVDNPGFGGGGTDQRLQVSLESSNEQLTFGGVTYPFPNDFAPHEMVVIGDPGNATTAQLWLDGVDYGQVPSWESLSAGSSQITIQSGSTGGTQRGFYLYNAMLEILDKTPYQGQTITSFNPRDYGDNQIPPDWIRRDYSTNTELGTFDFNGTMTMRMYDASSTMNPRLEYVMSTQEYQTMWEKGFRVYFECRSMEGQTGGAFPFFAYCDTTGNPGWIGGGDARVQSRFDEVAETITIGGIVHPFPRNTINTVLIECDPMSDSGRVYVNGVGGPQAVWTGGGANSLRLECPASQDQGYDAQTNRGCYIYNMFLETLN